MLTLSIVGIGYPTFLAALVAIDRATGWNIADAFGKERPS